ncbi:MAG: thiamine pyrophosphate-binding protein [Actinomycetota bacterium]|nr:thiamine pyrophosphate-binding protein [Actinomycetota bacterium]
MGTGGELLVAALERRGVEVVFGLPGVQLDGLFDALAQSSIRVVHARHEQATSYMADGYARATGRVGVCAVVPGPGVLNAGAGLATAYATGSPVLCLAGHLFGGDAVRGRGALHEIVDQSAAIEGTIGWTRRVHSPGEIDDALDAAFDRLLATRSLPAALEVGPDVLTAPTDASPRDPAPAPSVVGPEPAAVERAAAALAGRRRPVIVAGGGALGAGESLDRLAAVLGAPVVLTSSGKGAVSADQAHVLPPVAGLTLFGECDALIVVGSRFWPSTGRPKVGDDVTVVRIDADPARLDGDLAGALGVEGDASASCAALADALSAAGAAEPDEAWTARVAEVRAAVIGGLAEALPETSAYCRVLRDVIPDDGILVDEMTQVGYLAREAYPALRPRTYLGSGYQGTLGFGFSTALGAKVGCPDQVVVSISGDGGFLYNLGELATMAHHDIGVVTVVFVDDAYGNVKRIQAATYGREIASTLTNPDLVQVASAFSIPAARAEDPDALHKELEAAISRGGPTLIEVPIAPQPDIWAYTQGRRPLL